jgi:hypothetical protein
MSIADELGTEGMPRYLGECLYGASNGDLPIAEWKLVLYQNSTNESYFIHFLWHAFTKHLKYVFMHRLTLSVCPSN